MKPQPEPSTQEVLAGLVERVTYHNVENGFCVLRAKARGHRDVVTVVGHAATIAAGEWITASGEWVNDRTHGQQFRRGSCVRRPRRRRTVSRSTSRPA
jgi:exodeoxyribonuclease V alpha subunit